MIEKATISSSKSFDVGYITSEQFNAIISQLVERVHKLTNGLRNYVKNR